VKKEDYTMELELSPDLTVHNFAEWYRAGYTKQQPLARFARDMMKIENIAQAPLDSDPGIVYIAVLSLMEQIDDPEVFGLGLCWLDGKGHGEMPLSQVLRFRDGSPPGFDKTRFL
jgi:hypothetical protein